ncbi:outer membrane lipoprotein chaperone LolA [Legionella israelensis]|uniref:Outer-membrane lipoprotein carrier protein n=1 Tax=Legionella israelensis TaxID=454 RepID=A0AAX1EFU3_9GAMM|nr:outer membrane lipoprotein chaperone LolA [Legionella israelensis]QBR83956.1 outer membrane lipoprotein chaperone LolA [Legionella israelensis]
MKKWIIIFFLAAVKCGYSETAADILQKKLNDIRTMTASFSQVVNAKNRQVSQSSGTMALSRPGRFRWDTKSPMPQLVVADGERMWVYDVDLEQVTVKKQKKSLGGTAALFLSGYDDTVARDFDVKLNEKGKTQHFDMKAKQPGNGFQRVKMIFKGESLQRLDLYDQLGQITKVRFNGVKINPQLAQKLFKFKPPKGVDVIKQ